MYPLTCWYPWERQCDPEALCSRSREAESKALQLEMANSHRLPLEWRDDRHPTDQLEEPESRPHERTWRLILPHSACSNEVNKSTRAKTSYISKRQKVVHNADSFMEISTLYTHTCHINQKCRLLIIYLTTVGYSSAVYTYTMVKEAAIENFPTTAMTVTAMGYSGRFEVRSFSTRSILIT